MAAPQQLRLTLDGSPAPMLARRSRTIRNAAVYEAGSSTRRTIGWHAPTLSPNAAILSRLATLRDRSRAATRNDGYAKGALDKLVTNIIGTGIKPLSQAPDPEWRRMVHTLWLRWTDESDADGLLDFYGQQAQAVRTWLEAGEGFIRLRPRLPEDGLSVPLQLQVLEPELCPYNYDVLAKRIRAGIEFSPIGARLAYWFCESRPEIDDLGYGDWSRLRRVPADAIVHLYDPLRAGQLRGVPHLTQALIALYELDKYDDAALLRQQLANLFVGFLRRPSVIGDNAALHPLTDEEPDTETGSQGQDLATISMEPGAFQELAPGEEVQFSDPPEVRGYPDFMRQQLYAVAAATGVPYEVLTGDMRGVNDRTVRVILNEFRRRIQAYQHQIVAFQLCRRVWKAWLDRAVVSGALPMPTDYVRNAAPWLAVKWMPQAWPYIHPVQDVDAQQKGVRNGFTTRAAVVAEYGEDAEAIDQEQAADNARADRLGLRYDSDSRVSVSARGERRSEPAAPADERGAA